MKWKAGILAVLVLMSGIVAAGCDEKSMVKDTEYKEDGQDVYVEEKSIGLTSEITRLENGLSAVQYDGDYGFDEFLLQGGASSDADVVSFLMNRINAGDITIDVNGFGCSTLSSRDEYGNYIFGRNFDWKNCNAMIVKAVPENGYTSISTVNTDFIGGVNFENLSDKIRTTIALYAPMDGMNEKGFVVSVNMIQDSATINQTTEKPDITTTTAIRMLLDKASDVEEALELLQQYDMHASMGYMVHFAMADTDGCSVAVEYINNEITVINTPAVTNFYLAEGEKQGIGTEQSHTRYNILMEKLSQNFSMNMEVVRDALNSVSKGNFGEFESTEWSIVFNQSTGEVHYYHRENYSNRYVFTVKGRTS
jgi:predicted choloylglycine hydrolase